MKCVHPPISKKENESTRTIERGPKRALLEAFRDNIVASSLTDSKRIDSKVKDYLKDATETGIVNEVRGKAVAGFYMVNVSLERRVCKTANKKKKKVSKTKKQRCKVNKSSFDQRNNRGGNELLYI